MKHQSKKLLTYHEPKRLELRGAIVWYYGYFRFRDFLQSCTRYMSPEERRRFERGLEEPTTGQVDMGELPQKES